MAQRTVNKVILLGRIGKDAETKFTPSGTAKTTFSLATNWNQKDQQTGEWKEHTDWHNIIVWKQESLANYLLKGKSVYIEGRISNRSYDDKDGNKRYITEITADNVILVGGDGKKEGGDDGVVSRPRGAQQPPPRSTSFDVGITDDDVPF